MPRFTRITFPLLALAVLAAALFQPAAPAGATTPPDRPLVATYFYYWYDATTGQHLSPVDPLPTHPVYNPAPNWHDPAWFRKELRDMSTAGIDIVLPVYWGYAEKWSTDGLAYLTSARDQMLTAREPAPAVGMFFDTTILGSRDLTAASGMRFFYSNVRDFFSRVPRRHWALVSGRPVVWLYRPQEGSRFDQSVFTYTSDQFLMDFGVRPYIVAELGWTCAVGSWANHQPVQDCSKPITADATYVWGAAFSGFDPRGTVASIGPGYDESLIAGRSGLVRPRNNGLWFYSNFGKALVSRKRILAIETWNEFHEATGVGESAEYGRGYIDYTATLVKYWRQYLGSVPVRVLGTTVTPR